MATNTVFVIAFVAMTSKLKGLMICGRKHLNYLLFWLIIKYLLNTFCVPDFALVSGDTALTKTDKVPALIESVF